MTAPVRLLQPLFPGIVLYLPFWEGAGTFAEDVSPFRNHGAITGASWVDGVIGKALSFNGTTDYVSVPHSASLSILGDITIAFWIYLDDISVSHFGVTKTNGANPYPWDMYFVAPTGVIHWLRGNPARDMAGFTMSAGVWTHVVVTQEGWNVKFYKNGVLTHSPTMTATTITDGGKAVKIGTRDNFAVYTQGDFDDVRVFNRTLTPSEVWEEYYRGARQNY